MWLRSKIEFRRTSPIPPSNAKFVGTRRLNGLDRFDQEYSTSTPDPAASHHFSGQVPQPLGFGRAIACIVYARTTWMAIRLLRTVELFRCLGNCSTVVAYSLLLQNIECSNSQAQFRPMSGYRGLGGIR